jgi:hypothetical protein
MDNGVWRTSGYFGGYTIGFLEDKLLRWMDTWFDLAWQTGAADFKDLGTEFGERYPKRLWTDTTRPESCNNGTIP